MEPEMAAAADASSFHDSDLAPVGSPEEAEVRPPPSDDDFEREHEHGRDHDLDRDAVSNDNHDQDQSVASTAPAEDLVRKINKQVEYYFSDENLPHDKYMMGLIKKNKQGFVPIGILASFKKMKKLTLDHSVIASALRESSFLVVSSDGKKVKRLHPFCVPEVNDPNFFTVVVENLPEDHSLENIQKLFGEAGKIKNISIHDPHAAEDSKKGNKTDMLISCKLHALVEYETAKAAETAVATLNNEQDWRNGMRVKLLNQMIKQGQRRQVWREPDHEKNRSGLVPNHEKNRSGPVPNHEKNRSGPVPNHPGPVPNHPGPVPNHPGPVPNHPGVKENHNKHENPDNRVDEEGAENLSKENNGLKGRNRGGSRKNKHRGPNGLGHGTTSSAHPMEPSKPPPGPKMPDGTRGFSMGRGRSPVT